MAPEFAIAISWEHGATGDVLECATYCSLRIRLGDVTLTKVDDRAARTTRDVIRVSAYPLAVWLVAGWWRLRWEGERPGADWKLTHRLGGAGSGYAWPEVSFVSDGEWIHVTAERRKRPDWEPIDYLNDVRLTVAVSQFEATVDDVIHTVLARLAETGHRDNPLAELWDVLRGERTDPQVATARRFEALLGFDPLEAPADLFERYTERARQFGVEAVAELAATAENGSAPDWGDLSAKLDGGASMHIAKFQDVRAAARRAAAAGIHPWQRGERAARAVRNAFGAPGGPLSDEMLSSWMGADLDWKGSPFGRAAWARREREFAADLSICYRSAGRNGRRFECARLLADHLIAADPADTLLPATRAKTARQRLQRAFAAELLLPWEDLAERVGEEPDEEIMEDIAREYCVSPLQVHTSLVNKGRLPRDTLPEPV